MHLQRQPRPGDIPEPYCRATDLDLMRRIAVESDLAKQLLRKAGYGVTGQGLLDTVREALADGR